MDESRDRMPRAVGGCHISTKRVSMFTSKSLALALTLFSTLAVGQQSETRQLVLYRPSTSTFYIRAGENQAPKELAMGIAGDIPLWADINGDGKPEPGVYRKGQWLISTHGDGNADLKVSFGGNDGDVPLIADVDGDGRQDLVIFRAGEWSVRGTRNVAVVQLFHFGTAGDIPLLADFDGDGKIDFAVFRAGQWLVDTHRNGKADLTLGFGAANDKPLAVEWDGKKGAAALVVFRDGHWLVSSQRDGKVAADIGFGAKGDIPIAVLPAKK